MLMTVLSRGSAEALHYKSNHSAHDTNTSMHNRVRTHQSGLLAFACAALGLG